MNRSHIFPILLALFAALLSGVSTPLAKLFLGEVDPLLLASFLYLGCGFGVLVIKILQRTGKSPGDSEADISKADIK
ncbi:MAG TPA: hypothetical protein VMW28_06330 [Pelolinea sp.]|nr:hypothetical protein [Pelolinea sp.]